MTEVTVETPEEEPADDTVVVAPTVVIPESGNDDSDLAFKLGEALARIENLEAKLAETEQTAEGAEDLAEAAAALAVAEAMEPEPEPEPVIVDVEEDEEPVKEPWTHRANPFSHR